MMSDKDMGDLTSAKGRDFDKKFAQLMIGHHQGAVTMAKDEQKNGDNPDAKKLAGDCHRGAERRDRADEQDRRPALIPAGVRASLA